MITNCSLCSLDKRLQQLEEALVGDPVVILARDPEGQEVEMTAKEYGERWKSDGLDFIRILRGFDPTYRDIDLILSTWRIAAEEETQ